MTGIRDDILQSIIKKSERYNRQNINTCSASALSDELSISRSLASHYLNELADEQQLFKILSRPVYFLHRKTIEENYGVRIASHEFLSLDEFQHFLMASSGDSNVFTKLIGYDGSLMSMINQSTSALLYPPHGLPMILYGESGVGKGKFVSLLFDYGLNHHIFEEQATLENIILDDSHENSAIAEKRLQVLFKDTQRNGIVCIQHAQHMNLSMLQAIMTYIHRQKRKIARSGYLPILCMEKNPSKFFEVEFLQQFPVILYVPNLEERGLEEKEEALIRYLKREEKRTGKSIFISNTAFRAMCRYVYPLNSIDMQKMVMLACASAMDAKQANLQITTQHLSHEIGGEIALGKSYEDHTMMAVKDFSVDHDIARILRVYEEILQSFQQCREHEGALKDVVHSAYVVIKEYYDTTMFSHVYVSQKMKSMEKMLE